MNTIIIQKRKQNWFSRPKYNDRWITKKGRTCKILNSCIDLFIDSDGSHCFQSTFIRFQLVVLRVLQPILQEWIIKYFNGEPDTSDSISKNDVLIYSACLIINLVITVILMHHITLVTQEIGMRVRVACSSLVYRKVMLQKTRAPQPV